MFRELFQRIHPVPTASDLLPEREYYLAMSTDPPSAECFPVGSVFQSGANALSPITGEPIPAGAYRITRRSMEPQVRSASGLFDYPIYGVRIGEYDPHARLQAAVTQRIQHPTIHATIESKLENCLMCVHEPGVNDEQLVAAAIDEPNRVKLWHDRWDPDTGVHFSWMQALHIVANNTPEFDRVARPGFWPSTYRRSHAKGA